MVHLLELLALGNFSATTVRNHDLLFQGMLLWQSHWPQGMWNFILHYSFYWVLSVVWWSVFKCKIGLSYSALFNNCWLVVFSLIQQLFFGCTKWFIMFVLHEFFSFEDKYDLLATFLSVSDCRLSNWKSSSREITWISTNFFICYDGIISLFSMLGGRIDDICY